MSQQLLELAWPMSARAQTPAVMPVVTRSKLNMWQQSNVTKKANKTWDYIDKK